MYILFTSNASICYSGLLWIECKQIYSSGGLSYFTNYYNFMDYSVLSMYLASYVLRFFTEYMVSDADK